MERPKKTAMCTPLLSEDMRSQLGLCYRLRCEHCGPRAGCRGSTGRAQGVAVDGGTSERQGSPFLWWGAHYGPTCAHRGSLHPQVSHFPVHHSLRRTVVHRGNATLGNSSRIVKWRESHGKETAVPSFLRVVPLLFLLLPRISFPSFSLSLCLYIYIYRYNIFSIRGFLLYADSGGRWQHLSPRHQQIPV
jgi:hypothetical protein